MSLFQREIGFRQKHWIELTINISKLVQQTKLARDSLGVMIVVLSPHCGREVLLLFGYLWFCDNL